VPHTDPPERHFTGLINEINLLVARLFNRRMREQGLTRSQWQALYWLNQRDGLTQTELAELLVIARPPLGRIIDRLEQQGLVQRRADPADRRIKRVYITPRVTPLLGPAQNEIIAIGAAAMRDMNAAERAALTGLLEQARASLTAEDNASPGAG
jgi:DNA-binding MarR family transcriptional regulator